LGKKLKVLHMPRSNSFSGAENMICQIAELFRNDPDISIVYCSPDGPIREEVESRGIEFIPLEKVSVSCIKKMLRVVRPDLIHAHDMYASVMAAAACGNIPLICHIHNNSFDSRGLNLKVILFRIAAQKAKHIFWVSKSSFQGYYFHQSLESKSTILYNIVDRAALEKKMEQDTNNYKYDIVFLGRLTRPKNPDRLLRVFAKVTKLLPDISIGIIGTGELEDETRRKAQTLQLKNVEFLGFQSNPYKMLHDAKVMLMTSLWEGTPMCALEAMTLGVPIVSTPTDGLCDLVEHGVTGYLSDEDEELAEYCSRLVGNPQLREQMSLQSVKKARTMMDTELYRKTLKEVYQCST
jgi:glycosyltransferase involved in cell wall biosynthesis